MSKKNRGKAKTENAVAGAILCGLVGSVFGPLGTVTGAAIGAKLGYKQNPDKDEDL